MFSEENMEMVETQAEEVVLPEEAEVSEDAVEGDEEAVSSEDTSSTSSEEETTRRVFTRERRKPQRLTYPELGGDPVFEATG